MEEKPNVSDVFFKDVSENSDEIIEGLGVTRAEALRQLKELNDKNPDIIDKWTKELGQDEQKEIKL